MRVFWSSLIILILVLLASAVGQAQAQSVDGVEKAWRTWMAEHRRKTGGLAAAWSERVLFGLCRAPGGDRHNMVVHIAPRLDKGGGQGELDRTLGGAAEAVRNWPGSSLVR